MRDVIISELSIVNNVEQQDKLMVFTQSDTTPMTRAITIRQLLGMQQQVLIIPCAYCGSRGKYDIRGNCGACGAPVAGENDR